MSLVMEEKKKQRPLIHNLALAATKQVWMALVMEERRKRRCQIPVPALIPAMGNLSVVAPKI